MENKIRQAYERGLRIRCINWNHTFFIKKHSNTESIDEVGRIWDSNWHFDNSPETWEIWKEDLPLLSDTLPETLIINGIKYKRDDN